MHIAQLVRVLAQLAQISMPYAADEGGRLSLNTATLLDTIMMICVRFSWSRHSHAGDDALAFAEPLLNVPPAFRDDGWSNISGGEFM